jgi:hypothetical protein
MTALRSAVALGARAWNGFFFRPVDVRLCGFLRIAFAALLLLDNAVQWQFIELWYGEEGALPYAVSLQYANPAAFSWFRWLPTTSAALIGLYLLFNLQALLLLLGLWTRFQAASVFLHLISFQHRNDLIRDGEDIVFRMFSFFLIFLPLGGVWSLDAQRRRGALRPHPKWPLRLMQIQTCLVFLSSGAYKARGAAWRDGTALYYVSRLEDFFGRFWLPQGIFDSLMVLQLATWTVIFVELAIPIAIWIPRMRRLCIAMAIGLHLAIDYSMHLFLFQWVMMLGWLTFLTSEDLDRLAAWRDKLWGRTPTAAPSSTSGPQPLLQEHKDAVDGV